MPGLTPTSWQKFDKVLIKLGCQFKRKKGSHRVYWKAGLNRPLIIPEHNQELPVFVIIKQLTAARSDQ